MTDDKLSGRIEQTPPSLTRVATYLLVWLSGGFVAVNHGTATLFTVGTIVVGLYGVFKLGWNYAAYSSDTPRWWRYD